MNKSTPCVCAGPVPLAQLPLLAIAQPTLWRFARLRPFQFEVQLCSGMPRDTPTLARRRLFIGRRTSGAGRESNPLTTIAPDSPEVADMPRVPCFDADSHVFAQWLLQTQGPIPELKAHTPRHDHQVLPTTAHCCYCEALPDTCCRPRQLLCNTPQIHFKTLPPSHNLHLSITAATDYCTVPAVSGNHGPHAAVEPSSWLYLANGFLKIVVGSVLRMFVSQSAGNSMVSPVFFRMARSRNRTTAAAAGLLSWAMKSSVAMTFLTLGARISLSSSAVPLYLFRTL
mmetsp:Transcript_32750/g.54897  ORF Transcript_32750/g.54897 Transcript_32750/m.54897 type:complete len:284 (+) Transcript_32750:122-973(+)